MPTGWADREPAFPPLTQSGYLRLAARALARTRGAAAALVATLAAGRLMD